jgi:squalene-hopene/tetraprenyl-beta-curcumene cyclase
VTTAQSAPVVNRSLDEAIDWLVRNQSPEGWWCGELETNVTMTAEHVLLLRFLRLPIDPIRDGAIKHILKHQRGDGSWSLFADGSADLSTTIEAYVALKVLGVDPSSEPMARALRVIHEQGGLAEARVFTKIWLALFGEFPWAGVPSMPPELVNVPTAVPLNVYDFSCWARGTVAAMLIIISRHPIRDLGVSVREIVRPGTENRLGRVPGSGPFWWADRAQKIYDRLPMHPARQWSRARLVEWIIERQEKDGSWGGIQPPWVYSLIALNLEGYSTDHPIMKRGLQGLDGFSLSDAAEGWRLQACMSPVWDTAWTLIALRKAGLDQEDGVIQQAVNWLLKQQVFAPGDWQVKCKGVDGGGWAFEFENDNYPDVDDTTVVVLALLDAGLGQSTSIAVEKAAAWVMAMRSSNGAWGSFDRDNTNQLVYRLPFSDFGAMLDPPSEDVTAHALEMLARMGYTMRDRVIVDALAYLQKEQRPDGSWWGRWGVNHIYGTWCVIQALTAFTERTGSVQTMIDRGIAWLLQHQNADGGWGETCHSYEDSSFAGVGFSTPSQTAWAVISLQCSGNGDIPATQRGLDYLRREQVDGTWHEALYTGTGFPRDFYINYHLYRHIFPTIALASDVFTE